MKTILTYGLMGVALIANSNGIIPRDCEESTNKFESAIIQSKDVCNKIEKTLDDQKLDAMMMERMQQICKVLDVDGQSLTKEQMAELLNKVEEL